MSVYADQYTGRCYEFVEKMGVEKANIDRTFKDYKQQIAAVSTGEKAAEYIEELIRQAIRMRNERLGRNILH